MKLFLAALAFATVQAEGYADKVVVCLTPKTAAGVKALVTLSADPSLDFWSVPGPVGNRVDIYLARERAQYLLSELQPLGVEGTICIDDVQSLVDGENKVKTRSARVQGWHSSYHSYPEIISYFQDTIVPAAPGIATTFSIGSTYEGRDLMVVRVTGGAKTVSAGLPASNGLPAIWVQSLLHAREHLSGASLAYALERILTDYGSSAWATNLGAHLYGLRACCHCPPNYSA